MEWWWCVHVVMSLFTAFSLIYWSILAFISNMKLNKVFILQSNSIENLQAPEKYPLGCNAMLSLGILRKYFMCRVGGG